MKNHIHKSFTAIALLAVLGWGPTAWADTKVRASSFEYDASGLLTKEVVEPDSPNDCLQTSYSYDNASQLSSLVQNPAGTTYDLTLGFGQNPAGQITGLYTGAVHGDSFDVELPQVVVFSQPYTIAIFADANGNGRYDAPPMDAAWYAYATGDEAGITYVFAYNEDFDDVGF